MATVYADPDHLARVLRTINGHGWRQRLAPLAAHMANHHVVRARGERGAALALLDLNTLQQALMRLLRHAPTQGYLLIALTVQNAPVDAVAAEMGIDRGQVAGELREAVGALARDY